MQITSYFQIIFSTELQSVVSFFFPQVPSGASYFEVYPSVLNSWIQIQSNCLVRTNCCDSNPSTKIERRFVSVSLSGFRICNSANCVAKRKRKEAGGAEMHERSFVTVFQIKRKKQQIIRDFGEKKLTRQEIKNTSNLAKKLFMSGGSNKKKHKTE